MFGMIDPMYIAFAIPGLLLALYASFKTKSTFKKYSTVGSSTGMTGAQAAARLLRSVGIGDVKIEEVGGFLSDHYDPMSKTLRLSPGVYGSSSLSAIGVACHEAGHAIQHARGYVFMHMRTLMVPATNISTWLSYIVITAGMLLNRPGFILIGAVVFSAAVLFSIVTLPVEWDASSRARKMMVEAGVVHGREEAGMAGEVLNAAFLTYVAAAVSSLLTLAYYLMRAGVFGRRDD